LEAIEMVHETHAYRFVSKVSNPIELSEALKPFLSKKYSKNDRSKNCAYRTGTLTLVVSLTSGKIALYADKKDCLNGLKEVLSTHLLDELMKNLKQTRREIRHYKETGTKTGYSEDHIHTVNKVGRNRLPSSSANLQFMKRKIRLDCLDMAILGYVYSSNGCSVITKDYKRFNVGYHTFWRRLGGLYVMGLVQKLDISPALYVPIRNEKRRYEIEEMVGVWKWLFRHHTG